jgi:hypothetical protein
MRKRFTFTSLVVTVNILLLTFLMTAHHHHQGIPHFTWNEHETQHEASENDSDDCSDEKDASCLFEQNYVAVKPIKENNISSPSFEHNPYPDNYFQSLFMGFIFDSSLPDVHEPFRKPPYLITYHSIVARPGWGLRAPPLA